MHAKPSSRDSSSFFFSHFFSTFDQIKDWLSGIWVWCLSPLTYLLNKQPTHTHAHTHMHMHMHARTHARTHTSGAKELPWRPVFLSISPQKIVTNLATTAPFHQPFNCLIHKCPTPESYTPFQQEISTYKNTDMPAGVRGPLLNTQY